MEDVKEYGPGRECKVLPIRKPVNGEEAPGRTNEQSSAVNQLTQKVAQSDDICKFNMAAETNSLLRSLATFCNGVSDPVMEKRLEQGREEMQEKIKARGLHRTSR